MLREFFEDNLIQIRHAFNSYKEVIAEDGNRVDGYVEYNGIIFLCMDAANAMTRISSIPTFILLTHWCELPPRRMKNT
jgi:hypothetical protein